MQGLGNARFVCINQSDSVIGTLTPIQYTSQQILKKLFQKVTTMNLLDKFQNEHYPAHITGVISLGNLKFFKVCFVRALTPTFPNGFE